MVPGQPPLAEQADGRGGGGMFLRPVPSPLGPKGFKPPTLTQLYSAVSNPGQRGWLDALQVREGREGDGCDVHTAVSAVCWRGMK